MAQIIIAFNEAPSYAAKFEPLLLANMSQGCSFASCDRGNESLQWVLDIMGFVVDIGVGDFDTVWDGLGCCFQVFDMGSIVVGQLYQLTKHLIQLLQKQCYRPHKQFSIYKPFCQKLVIMSQTIGKAYNDQLFQKIHQFRCQFCLNKMEAQLFHCPKLFQAFFTIFKLTAIQKFAIHQFIARILKCYNCKLNKQFDLNKNLSPFMPNLTLRAEIQIEKSIYMRLFGYSQTQQAVKQPKYSINGMFNEASLIQSKFIINMMSVAQDNEKGHILSHIIPNTLCKLLNNAIIIINLWWAQNSQFLTVGMGFATIFSFVCGYLLIISLNIGLTYQISRKRSDPILVGIFYQRALLVNFLFCAFFITPLLYISDRIVGLFKTMIPELEASKAQIGNYLYQLVPSIWAFAFYDTTQTFLQAQGRILAPLIIQFIAVIMHLALIRNLGPAWSKNFADFFSSVAIYCYIIFFQKKLKSWTQWTIKCIKGWRKHIRFLQIIGLATYTQAIFFFFFSLLAYKLKKEELICHIYYINIYQIIYLIFIGIQQGSLAKMGYLIEKNQHKIYRREGIQSIKLCVGACVLLVSFMYIYQQEIHTIFRNVYQQDTSSYYPQSPTESAIFYDNFIILSLSLLVDSYQIGVSSMLKALNTSHSILRMLGVFYILTYCLCFILCYYYDMGLRGLWVGWLIGLIINSLIQTYILRSEDKLIRKNWIIKQNDNVLQTRNI